MIAVPASSPTATLLLPPDCIELPALTPALKLFVPAVVVYSVPPVFAIITFPEASNLTASAPAVTIFTAFVVGLLIPVSVSPIKLYVGAETAPPVAVN